MSGFNSRNWLFKKTLDKRAEACASTISVGVAAGYSIFSLELSHIDYFPAGNNHITLLVPNRKYMEQSQLLELVQTLSPGERNQLLEYASMQIITFGESKPFIINLLDLCVRICSGEQQRPLSPTEIYIEVFSDEKQVDGKLEKLMVKAHKVVKNFLLFLDHTQMQSEFERQYHFSRILKKKGLTARFRNSLLSLRKIQESQIYRTPEFYLQQFRMEYAFHDEASLNNQAKGDLNIPNVLLALETHYQLNKIALLNRLVLQQKVAVFQLDDATREILEHTSVPEFVRHDSLLINIHHTIFALLSQEFPTPENARILFELLQNHEKELGYETLREFYTYLRNICVLVLSHHPENSETYSLLFDLYTDNLDRGLLHYEGKLHPSRYLAISEYAARVKKHDWALEFIERYKDEIIGDNETRDIYRLNLAFYYFAIGDFESCIDHIPGASPYLDYMLAGKRLELKALYELNSSLLPYKLDAFKMFLSRTSHKILAENRRQKNLEFVNFLVQVVSIPPGDFRRAERVFSRIEGRSQASEREWLMGKVLTLAK